MPTTATLRPLSSSPTHRPWAKSARHCIGRFRIELVSEVGKTLTKASIADIQKALN